MGKIIGIMDDCFESPDNYEDKDKEVDINEIQEEENNENNENNDIDDD